MVGTIGGTVAAPSNNAILERSTLTLKSAHDRASAFRRALSRVALCAVADRLPRVDRHERETEIRID
jgi:hypothetical protein